MAFIEVSDFTGKFLLSKNNSDTTLIQKYIDEYQLQYFGKVFGADMGQVVYDYLNTTPTPPVDPILDAIIAPFLIDNSNIGRYWGYHYQEKVLVSKGVKSMIMGFIYYHYMVDMMITPSATGGFTRNKNENSVTPTIPAAQIYERYNASIDTSIAIQYKMSQNTEDYPDHGKGEEMLYNYYL